MNPQLPSHDPSHAGASTAQLEHTSYSGDASAPASLIPSQKPDQTPPSLPLRPSVKLPSQSLPVRIITGFARDRLIAAAEYVTFGHYDLARHEIANALQKLSELETLTKQ